MNGANGWSKRFPKQGLRAVASSVFLLALAAAAVNVYHAYERRHVKVIEVDDINTKHDQEISKLPAQDQARILANIDMLDDFAGAFAEDQACRGLTLIRESQFEGAGGSIPYAYWYADLYPQISERSDATENSDTRSYSGMQWDIWSNEGNEYEHSQISEFSLSAKDAVHRICVIARNRGGNVW